MKLMKSHTSDKRGARDKRQVFDILCGVFGGVALLTGICALVASSNGSTLGGLSAGVLLAICVICLLATLPMFVLRLSGYADGHARRGVGSALLHIALFGELAILCIVLGIIGGNLLKEATKIGKIQVRENVYESMGDKDGELYNLMTNAIGIQSDNEDELQDFKNYVLSGVQDSIENLIHQEIFSGTDEQIIFDQVLDKFINKAKKEYPDKADELTEATEEKRDFLFQHYHGKAEEEYRITDARRMKDELMNPAETENYAIMYFSTALIIAGIILALLDALLIILWYKKDETGRAHIGERLEPLDYLLPFLIGVGIFTLYPTIRVFIMSFQEGYRATKNGAGEFTRWGFGNYSLVINGIEGNTRNQFLDGLKNTALYVLFTVPITAALAIVIAYLLNQKSKLSSLFQTAYFLPMVTTATAVGLVWRWMFNADHGLINMFITAVSQFFGAPDKINWLGTGRGDNAIIPLTVLIIYGIWNSLPFTIILLLSGLQNIDENLYTVAKVDGSSGTRIFFKITVPLLSPTIGLVLIINSISAFKVYTDVFVLWSGKPDGMWMETVAWYIYNNVQNQDNSHGLGFAAASAMILFAIIFVFTMVQKFIQRKWVYQ